MTAVGPSEKFDFFLKTGNGILDREKPVKNDSVR